MCVCVCVRVCACVPVRTFGSGWAGAEEAVDQVDARPSVATGVGLALVHVVLAVHALIAGLTLGSQEGGGSQVRG